MSISRTKGLIRSTCITSKRCYFSSTELTSCLL